jgi:hypothetical protein
MMRTLATLCLLLTTVAYGQGNVPVSGFVARWEDVPAPTLPVVSWGVSSGVYPTIWNGWQWGSTPGGRIEVCNALVDRSQRAGAWSQPAVLDVRAGWELTALPVTNQPNDPRAAGIVWRVTMAGKVMYYQDGIGSTNFQSYSPNSSLSTPRPISLTPFGDGFGHQRIRTGGIFTTPAPPPAVLVSSVPDEDLEAAYAWVCNSGETALSPVGTLPRNTDPRVTPGGVCRRALKIGVGKVPWGALGYHLYLRRPGGEWHRQPSRVCGAAPSLDEYLWQPNQNYPQLHWFREDTPGPLNTPRPQSHLSAAQVAMKYTRGDLTITEPQTICCPFVDEYEGRVGPAEDPARLPYVGSETVHKFAPNRTITFTTGATVTPGMAPYHTHATFYPALLVEGRSTFVGMQVNGQAQGIRNFSAGVQFRDYSGGQSMGGNFRGCSFSLRSDDPAWQTKGVEVAWECAGNQGHTASELQFADCRFTGCVCIWIENNQSANIRFTGKTFASNFVNDRRCPCMWLDAPVEFNFEGALYCQGGGTVFALGWNPIVNVDKIFVDQPFVSLVDANSYQPGRVTFNAGKVNAFSPDDRNAPNLFRVFNSTSEFPVSLDGLTVQANTAEGLAAVHMAPHRAKVLAERSNVLDVLTLHEPTVPQFDAVSNWKNTEKEPGVRIEIPKRPVRDAAGRFAGSVDAVTLTFNSLTGTTQKVKRKGWQ